MTKNMLLLFTRNPEYGKVKTRLAKTIGKKAALAIYTFLLEHTKNVTKAIPVDKAVYYSVKIRENDTWPNDIFTKHQQIGSDLGERMEHAFLQAFQKNYDKVVIIGSDLYDLQRSHIEEAFTALDNHDVVIGPAKDGGYYLLGLKKAHPTIFKNKPWGTSTVLEDTLKDTQNLKVHLLEECNDIDIYEDIAGNIVFEQFYK